MYLNIQCTAEGCKKTAMSCITDDGRFIENCQFCYKHVPDPDAAKERIYKYIREHDKIVGLNCQGLTFKGIELTDKKFYGCDFSHCFFQELKTNKLRMRMCRFDFF